MHQYGLCPGNHINLHGSLLIDYQHDLYLGNPVNLHVSLRIDHQHDLYPGNSVDNTWFPADRSQTWPLVRIFLRQA